MYDQLNIQTFENTLELRKCKVNTNCIYIIFEPTNKNQNY